MGQIAAAERCQRFIEAFNDWAVEHYGPRGEALKRVTKSHGLGIDMIYMTVRYYLTLEDTHDNEQKVNFEREVIDDTAPIFFDGNSGDASDIIETAVTSFEAFFSDDEDFETKVRDRLVKAGLIDPVVET